MKRKNRIRILSVLLIVCFFCSYLPAAAIAASQEETPAEAPREITLSDVIAGVATIEDLYGKLDESVVPDAIGYEEAVKKQHVARLYEEEGNDLNKVIFLNADGSKTMYSFDFPVKYQAASGEIQDISLKIADSKLSTAPFTSAAGNAVTTFSANLSDGISLSGNGVNIDLVPLLPAGSSGNNMAQTGSMSAPSGNMTLHTATRLDDKTVSYYYDDKTTIEYSLTYTGFKEDIVVSEYTGQTEYSFLLSTGGYALEEIDGSYFLVDDAGNIKATIGDIIIFTADERNNTLGQIVPRTVKEKEQYLLTIVIDEDYLADENTAYPIRIDPTLEITYAQDGAGKIEDATVYTADTTNTYLGSIFVGNKQNGGIARILMKFPGLDLDGLGDNVYIESASVSLRDLLCEATSLDVYCYVYTGGYWSEATGVTWEDTIEAYDEYLSTYLDMQTISYTNGAALSNPHRYHFDITEAVQGWVDGDYAQNKGIIFKAADSVETGSTYNWKTLSSYNRGSYEPRLSVTYSNDNNPLVGEGSYYINNLETGKYLKYASGSATGSSGTLAALGNSIQWQIDAVEDAYVIRAVSNPSLYLGVPEDFDESGPDTVIETVSGTDIPENCLWWIDLAESTGCLIQSQYNGEYLYSYGTWIESWVRPGEFDTAEYDQYVWRIVSTEDYGNNSSYTNRELVMFSVKTCYLDAGGSATPRITLTPTSAVWSDSRDFTYSNYDTNIVSYDSTTYKFTASSLSATYIDTIYATHKVTGKTVTFYIVVNRQAVLVGVTNLGHSHDVMLQGAIKYIYYDSAEENCGYTSVDYVTGAFDPDDINNYLNSAQNRIFVSRGHGKAYMSEYIEDEQQGTAILLNDAQNNNDKIWYGSDGSICNLDLSNMELVMFIGCETAANSETSTTLPGVAVSKGAKAAIGFETKIKCDEASQWTEDFFELMGKGSTVYEALLELDRVYGETSMKNWAIYGDTQITIKVS